jgi:hypothetical protein
MNEVRTAILKAADTIEQHPERWDFMKVHTPGPRGGLHGCALGWIGYHLGMVDSRLNQVLPPLELGTASQFYSRIEYIYMMAHGRQGWHVQKCISVMSTSEVAACMRAYADWYHPAVEAPTGIPSSVAKLFIWTLPRSYGAVPA